MRNIKWKEKKTFFDKLMNYNKRNLIIIIKVRALTPFLAFNRVT